MKMYSDTYNLIREADPEYPLVKAMDAEFQARLAYENAMAALVQAHKEVEKAEVSHYDTYMSDARQVFGDKPFTAREFEEAVGGYVSKHSIASMVYLKDHGHVSSDARTRRLLPPDLKDIGTHKKVEQYFLPCDASGKPIEGAEPIKRTSKGSKLYKFVG